ncbi:uncharacterized protein [Triticum aestivum]|uniref:uncharacterized protein isoform X3 n=1 Tax=Triticum aestivum TaxID=4565 RepID=UPI001D007A09|nr:uncharacterized protein LOC123131619 isoform X3 [Triticum aestivum]
MALELAASYSQQNVSMVAPSQDECGLDPVDHEPNYDQSLKISEVVGEVEENTKTSKDYTIQLPHPDCEEIIPTPPLSLELHLRFSQRNTHLHHMDMEARATHLANVKNLKGLQAGDDIKQLRAGAEMIRNGALLLMRACDASKGGM